ncbi:poly(A)-specific ribonuclease PARN [Mercurialis annua]|uniref:poly(A)-specific ribonuclease PARN n=1 Tax=Mercurialis annua TaxID=3986 RepID=UPI00215E9BE6|nr:poly(A)-specific ribonuclease PARN [Mercurialis annua]
MAKQWPFRLLSRALSRAYSSPTSPTAAAASTTADITPSFPLKHVTKANFNSSLADLKDHVRAADFIAIDLEMTGITSAPWRELFEYDRFDVRYLKMKDSAEKFAVVQFGVCPFHWDSTCQSFIAHPYNFFIFREDNEFLCQATSLDFLAKYQFDFNICIREGVSYLSRRQEEEELRRLNSRYEDYTNFNEVRDVPLVGITDVLFSERMKNRLSEWRDGLMKNRNEAGESQFETIFYKMRPALCLSGFTSHQLKLIQLVTKKHFKDLAYVGGSHSSSVQDLVVYVDSKNDKDSLMEEVKAECRKRAEMKINNTIGFRHVIDLLSSAQKLIVGHNCFLDIAHIHSKFLGPLPPTAEEFVSSVNKYFPHIVDTKVLLNGDNVLLQRMKKSRTSLSSAFSLLCPKIAAGSQKGSDLDFRPSVNVEVQVDDTRSSSWRSGVKHEAGYDAFMTGCVFAQICSHLGVDFKLHSSSENLAHNEKLQKHINHLYLSWINWDIIDLRTGSRVVESSGSNGLRKRHTNVLFENTVLIWRFPSRLKAGAIKDCICKVFGPNSVTSIFHVDETAVFVQFNKPELVSEFLVLKESLDRSNDPISVLHPLSKLLEGGNTCAAGYETYKEICSSPISKVRFADQAEAIGIKWKTKLVEAQAEETTTAKSTSAKKSEVGNQHARDNGSSTTDRLLSDEVIECFYAAEGKQRASTQL